MAFKLIHASDVPRRPRKAGSRFENTNEWKFAKAKLDKGLAPTEAIAIMLSDDDKANYGLKNRRTIARFIVKYLADHELPYTLKSFTEGTSDCFFIHNPRKARPASVSSQ
jgi:hypothetical protein